MNLKKSSIPNPIGRPKEANRENLKSITLSICVSPLVKKSLDKISYKHGMSISDIVRDSIDLYLQQE